MPSCSTYCICRATLTLNCILSILEVRTLKNVKAAAKKQAKLEHTVKWGALGVVLGWLGNFGLIWVLQLISETPGLLGFMMYESAESACRVT